MPWWLYLALLPVVGYVHLVLHELSHAIAAMSTGATITSWKLYPHKADDTFWFGRVLWAGGRPATVWWSAPLYLDMVLAGAAGMAGLWFAPLWLFCVTSALDALNWLRGYFGLWITGSDGQKWRAMRD